MILVVAVGQKQPDWVNTAFNDYANRFPPDHKLTLKEIKAEPRTTGKTVSAMKLAEANRINTILNKESGKGSIICVALDERGKTFTTEEFARFLDTLKTQSADIAFVIGGPDGLDDGFKQTCQHQIRLSSLTLPHGLARVLLAEQLYRAWSLTSHHPYHRA